MPKVAIIGGGIFGVSAAIELGKFCEVAIFEKRNDLMMEGTYGNQYRHHFGYHYPRSSLTVKQCQAAEEDFNSVWGKAIIRDFPAYYCIAKKGSRVSAKEFLSFCDELKLPYKFSWPESEFLNREAVDLCIETKEPVYHHALLQKIAKEYLAANPSIILKLEHEVVGARIDERNGLKILTVKSGKAAYEESFNYALNATYANYNLFCQWMNFPTREIEFRLKEIFLISLPIRRKIAVTVMDGSFVTLMPTGDTGIFTLGDVGRSKRDIKLSSGGVPWKDEEMVKHPTVFYNAKPFDEHFIPIVKEAKFIKSMFSVLPIAPNSDSTDARPTIITNHGFGCWSAFEGKIVTCVSAAKTIAGEIRSFI